MPEERDFGFGGEFEAIQRRQLPMFFLLDCSGSMEGTKIGCLNHSMREVLKELQEVGEADADIKVAILKFSSGFQWVTPTPKSPHEIAWEDIEAGGVTDMGDAYKELEKRLSRKEFMPQLGSTFAPVIIMLSDGDPTDDWEAGLEALNNNNWFKNARKVAMPIGESLDKKVLAAFTGNPELVVKESTNPAELRKMLKAVAIKSATFGSRSRIRSSEEGGGPVLDPFVEEMKTISADPVTPDDFIIESGDGDSVDISTLAGYDGDEVW